MFKPGINHIISILNHLHMNEPKLKAVLFKSKTYLYRTHPIMIRITMNRKTTYKSLGYSVLTDAWYEDNQCAFEKKPVLTKRQEGQLNQDKLLLLKTIYKNAIVLSNARHINSIINDTISEIQIINTKLKVNDEKVDLIGIKKIINANPENNQNDFFLLADVIAQRFFDKGSVGTSKRYKSVIKKLKDYNNSKPRLFSNIDVTYLEQYEIYLLNCKLKTNTIHNQIKSIRAI